MGVTGLLPQLKPIQHPVTMHRYEGRTLAVDGYAWLHRAAHGCCEDLCLGEPTTRYLSFFIKKVEMLRLKYNVTPYMVFDGDRLDAKEGTELKRRERRVENRRIGLELHRSGDKKKAWEYFQKSVDVTPQMAKCWIEYCKVHGIPYVVAPFEADAQMVYLEQQGFVDGIISEDSDLLVFGCKTLITKLKDNGEAIEICRSEFSNLPRKFPLYELSAQEFQTLVCLSGCDYTDGINRVGLVKAMELVRKYRRMDKIILSLQREGKYEISKSFIQEYTRATICFQYQRVFCPKLQKLVTLNPLPEDPLQVDPNFFEYIGYGICKESGEKKYISEFELINHEAHHLIALGEKIPGNHLENLHNRETALTQSFSTCSSTPTITPSIKSNEKVDVTGYESILNRPAKRSLTIDSFFIQSKKSSQNVTTASSSATTTTISTSTSSEINKTVVANRSAIRNRIMVSDFTKSSSSSSPSSGGNTMIDKRRLVSHSTNSTASKFFQRSLISTPNNTPKTTVVPSISSDDDEEEEDDEISFDISKDDVGEDLHTETHLISSSTERQQNSLSMATTTSSSSDRSTILPSTTLNTTVQIKKPNGKQVLQSKNPNILTPSYPLSKSKISVNKLTTFSKPKTIIYSPVTTTNPNTVTIGTTTPGSTPRPTARASTSTVSNQKFPSLSRFIYREKS